MQLEMAVVTREGDFETNQSNIPRARRFIKKPRTERERERERENLKSSRKFHRTRGSRMAKFGNAATDLPIFFLSFLHACSSLFLPSSTPLAGEARHRGAVPQQRGVAHPVSRAILNANFIKDFYPAVGILLNFYSYRFKARSEIYRANICLIFKMHRLQGVL